MEVPSPSFPITHVLPVRKMKVQEAKNKDLKPQGTITYLTQFKINIRVYLKRAPFIRMDCKSDVLQHPLKS
jgi:hypothetical protein